MTDFRKKIINASKENFKANITKHQLNIEILMTNGVGVAEHPDVMTTIEQELALMAEYQDKLEMLERYFGEGPKL